MKAVVPQKKLLAALSAAARAVEKRSTVPILTHVLIEAQPSGALIVTGTDLDITASTRVDANVDDAGSFCVPAATFSDMARKFESGADVSLALDGDVLTVRSGRSRFKLPTLPASDFPDAERKNLPHGFDLHASSLSALFGKTFFAISKEEVRFYLNGIYLHFVEVGGAPKLRAVATDGHRLARFDIPAPEGSSGMPGVIMPRKTVETVLRHISESDGAVASVALSENQIRFAMGPTTIVSKLIDGTFPDYARVIPQDLPHRATLDSAAFSSALARVSTIQSARGRAVKLSFGEGGALRLSVRDPDHGDATDEIDVDWKGEPLEVGFNGSYVQTILSAISSDRVVMKLSDPGSPCVFISPESEAMLAVLMPMRV
jgi:DNA polymerase-3 subunit beta